MSDIQYIRYIIALDLIRLHCYVLKGRLELNRYIAGYCHLDLSAFRKCNRIIHTAD